MPCLFQRASVTSSKTPAAPASGRAGSGRRAFRRSSCFLPNPRQLRPSRMVGTPRFDRASCRPANPAAARCGFRKDRPPASMGASARLPGRWRATTGRRRRRDRRRRQPSVRGRSPPRDRRSGRRSGARPRLDWSGRGRMSRPSHPEEFDGAAGIGRADHDMIEAGHAGLRALSPACFGASTRTMSSPCEVQAPRRDARRVPFCCAPVSLRANTAPGASARRSNNFIVALQVGDAKGDFPQALALVGEARARASPVGPLRSAKRSRVAGLMSKPYLPRALGFERAVRLRPSSNS